MDEPAIFDKEGALERVEDDTELFFELIEMFFEDYDGQVSTIASSIENSEARALEESAHSLKSALGNIGAMKSYTLAYELEKLGREGNPKAAQESLEQLKESVSQFKSEVLAFQKSL